ncbi:FlbE protein [Candidatus Phaeomarinobacter ectocarpi]|uniref:Flagellar assembly protein FliH n=1 Tax=Candidatus Phaeomarinibacter ectocarpi TaxID=1458461 RepID=X5MKS3_9HYPH|nr:FliH/SctL family protein [Candidatus Phaeomarinobacter ectocarpi]CDO58845.1 FlbE protein [Candidatus Phaeomarinobacter ectocarpi]
MSNPAIITLQESSRFEFDRELSKGAVIQPRAERKKTKWTEDEVNAIRAEAFAAGEEAARTSDEAELSHRIAEGSQQVAERLNVLLENLHTERAKLREEAAEIALTIARKLMPALMETAPTSEIEAVVEQSFALLRNEARVVIHVAEDQQGLLEQRITDMTREHGFEGQLVLRSSDDVDPGDVRIEWASGAITRDTPALDASIEQIVRTYLSAPGADQSGQTDFFALLGKQQ